MPGKKNRGERKRGGGGDGGLADMFGLSGMPDIDDNDLEAELLAITGGGGGGDRGKKKSKGDPKMSLADIDKMVAGLDDVGEDDDDLEEGDLDDDDLLQELQELQGDSPPSPPPPAKTKEVHIPPVATPSTKPQSGELQTVLDRQKMYETALTSAKQAGESSKARRYERSVKTINTMVKQLKAGKKVDIEDLPPPVAIAAGGSSKGVEPPTPAPRPAPRQAPVPQSKSPQGATVGKQPRSGNLIDLDAPEFDEFNLSEEDMAMMAASLVDDRKAVQQESPPTVSPKAPTPLPRTQQPPSAAPREPPKASPRTQQPPSISPKPPPAKPSQPSKPPGLIDLDAPEFAEFDMTDEELAALAAAFVDDRAEPKEEPAKLKPPPPQAATQSLPAKVQPSPGGPPTKESVLAVLQERKEQYHTASMKAKKSADTQGMKRYGRVAVQFDHVVKALNEGQPIDLSQMPPPPPGFKSSYNVDISKFAVPTPPPTASVTQSVQQTAAEPEEEPAANPEIPIPKTALEALQQRLEKYKQGQKNAQEAGESSRVRRTGRIVKQYEEAIKMVKAGKTMDLSELPCPPGYPPIPAAGPAASPRPSPQPRPVAQSLPASIPTPRKAMPSLSDKHLQILQERMGELRQAAREAKAKNDRESALRYLRFSKGVEQMLQAAQNGLPVDLTQLPPSPYADPSSAKPSKAVLSHLKPAAEGDEETFELIETQLQEQMDVCNSNAEIFEKLGNIPAASQYKNMADKCQRDLLAIKGIRSQKLGPPKFTMEMRKFAIVHSNTELGDKEAQVEVLRGITVPCPSGYSEADLNLYIEIEFPWPQDNPQKESTSYVKASASPQFDSKHKFEIDRKQSRSLQRVFKRQLVKLTIYQHRTLRRDIFVGQAAIPLEGLENKCEVHMACDLKDEKGRKPVGGKLEVYVRLREPLSGRDQEEKEQKWLVFQEAIAAEQSVSMLRPKAEGGGATGSIIKLENTTSVEALKLELAIAQKAIKTGNKDPLLPKRVRQIQSRMMSIKQKLAQEPSYKMAYQRQVMSELKQERAIVQQLLQSGRTADAAVVQGRCKVMEAELTRAHKK